MIRTVGLFLGGSLLAWLVIAGIGYAIWKKDALPCTAATGAICLVPCTLALMLALWSVGRSGADQLMAVTGAMLLRMGGVLGLSVLVFLSTSYFRTPADAELKTERAKAYWGSLLLFYLFTLGWETLLVVREKRRRTPTDGVVT